MQTDIKKNSLTLHPVLYFLFLVTLIEKHLSPSVNPVRNKRLILILKIFVLRTTGEAKLLAA